MGDALTVIARLLTLCTFCGTVLFSISMFRRRIRLNFIMACPLRPFMAFPSALAPTFATTYWDPHLPTYRARPEGVALPGELAWLPVLDASTQLQADPENLCPSFDFPATLPPAPGKFFPASV